MLPESYQALVPGALPDGKLPVSKRTIDETKVTDHHAILPTPKRINLDSLPEDEQRRAEGAIQKITDKFIAEVDESFKKKEAEVMEV